MQFDGGIQMEIEKLIELLDSEELAIDAINKIALTFGIDVDIYEEF